MKKTYIIYISGLGDKYDGLRRSLLFFWQIFGVKTELVPMKWYDGKSYQEKFHRVKAAIKRAEDKGYEVSLVGESAGASMAMNVFSGHESVHHMISLCGVNSPNTPISSYIFRKSPAFQESVSCLEQSQRIAVRDRASSIVSVTALSDPTVPVAKNVIPGARHMAVWSIGHFTTIILCLSVLSLLLVRIAKR